MAEKSKWMYMSPKLEIQLQPTTTTSANNLLRHKHTHTDTNTHTQTQTQTQTTEKVAQTGKTKTVISHHLPHGTLTLMACSRDFLYILWYSSLMLPMSISHRDTTRRMRARSLVPIPAMESCSSLAKKPARFWMESSWKMK